MTSTEVIIEDCQDWLERHDKVHIENRGVFEILTANKHGELQVGNPSRAVTVNITDPDVTVL